MNCYLLIYALLNEIQDGNIGQKTEVYEFGIGNAECGMKGAGGIKFWIVSTWRIGWPEDCGRGMEATY